MTSLYFFDLDGTLVNTQELNRLAYEKVGITIPSDAWGKRWQDWLIDIVGDDLLEARRIHEQKSDVYFTLLHNSSVRTLELPATRVARDIYLRGNNVTYCLTAAAMRTARLILDRLGLHILLASNLSYKDRHNILDTSSHTHQITYVDDNEDNVTRLRQDLPKLHVVRYTNQSYEQLSEEVYKRA